MSQYLKHASTRLVTQGVRTKKTLAGVTNATQALFTVTGVVIIQGIVGFVTTAMDGTTTSININHDPTIGSAVNLCAATVVTSDVAGTVYGYLGDAITTLLVSSGTTAPNEAIAPMPNSKQVLTPGVIGLVGTAADAGVVDWYCLWTPLSDDGLVVAA
jgi:hypothetical protein